ncbi:MAG: hypothetical protein QOH93_2149 [Chloroflexia bacterium]|jgi:hypothetical protein|nr:hypothetical protein [Chloroflexia bacterium]
MSQAVYSRVIQFGALLIGAVYLVLGLAGFIPSDAINPLHHEHIETPYLLNLVAINALHNVIHLAIGVTGLLASRRLAWARQWGVITGVVLLLLFLAGMVQAALEGLPPDQLFLGVLPLNSPGHILHLVTGALALYLGLVRLPTPDGAGDTS